MIELEGLPDNPGAFFMLALIIGFGVVAAAKFYGLICMRWKSPFRVGEAMSVNRAKVVEWSGEEGYVSAGGELWRAASKDSFSPGDNVAISAVNGLLLTVKRQA